MLKSVIKIDGSLIKPNITPLSKMNNVHDIEKNHQK